MANPYNGFYVDKYHPPRSDAMSEVLYDFLNHWIYRSENHRYYGDSEFKNRGLCRGFVEYYKCYHDFDEQSDVDKYIKELRAMFVEDGLDEAFPFTDGIEGYLAEENCFLNKKRKDWVQKRLRIEEHKRRTLYDR